MCLRVCSDRSHSCEAWFGTHGMLYQSHLHIYYTTEPQGMMNGASPWTTPPASGHGLSFYIRATFATTSSFQNLQTLPYNLLPTLFPSLPILLPLSPKIYEPSEQSSPQCHVSCNGCSKHCRTRRYVARSRTQLHVRHVQQSPIVQKL